MIDSGVKSKQKRCAAWTWECLLHERAIALGQVIDVSTWKNYSSALNLYLLFVRLHNFPVEPTADTISFFTIFMCHHIKPDQSTLIFLGYANNSSCTSLQSGISANLGYVNVPSPDANDYKEYLPNINGLSPSWIYK